MALFENFPYTNLHELNLDWIINELNRIKDTTVLSVNGQTGDVILYENATVQFPNVPEDHWSMIRMANGTERGILFGNDDKAYIVHGNLMAELYGLNNQPPYPVTSVNGQTGDIVLYSENAVRLPNLDDITLHNWNIFRELNNNFLGIEFNEDGTASIIFNTTRDRIYTANNPPPYPVTSVNGKTGDVNLYSDNNGVIAFPAITDAGITGWIMGRNLNGTPSYIQLNDDGTLEVTAGVNNFRVYTTDDTSADIINVPTDANTDMWGLIRTTSEGSVGIMFSNDDQLTQPEAYIRYVDSMDIVHTEKLLTSADIPSASGVVSFNGQTGVVVVKGSDLIVSTTDTRTIAQAISDSAITDYAIKGAMAYVENTNVATQNIPSGAYVIWQNDDYVSTQAISIGDTLSGTNLSALSGGGITNNLKDTINSNLSNLHPTAELSSISEIVTLVGKPENNGYALFRVTQALNNSLTGVNKHATVLAFKASPVSNYIEFLSLDYDGDVRTGSYNVSSNTKSVYQASVHIGSITGTTSSSGNVSKTFDKHAVVLSAWSSSSGCVVTPYPGSGADDSGQNTWWFHVCSDAADTHVIANTSLTVYYTYMFVNG